MLKKYINKLDELWATAVKVKKSFTCEHCGIRGIRMEAAHVVGRRYRSTRWGAVINGVFDICGHCLCHNCHQQYDEHGPLERAIVVRTIGQERLDRIQAFAVQRVAKDQCPEEIERLLEEYAKK